MDGRFAADVAAVSGTVSGTSVAFTITTSNGKTFLFNGAFASTPAGTAEPWLIGTISGSTLPPVGTTFVRQGP